MRDRWVGLCVAAWLAGACEPPPAAEPSFVTRPGTIVAERLLGAAATAAREAGAGELHPIAAQHLAEGEMLGSFVTAARDVCVLVLSRGGKGVGDVDLFVYDDGGNRLVADEASEPRAAVLVCPPHPRRLYVVSRAMNGTGIVALGLMRVPVNAADAVAASVSARGRPGADTGKLDAWPGLERRIRERRASLGSTWEDVRRVAVPLALGTDTAVSAIIPARRCVDVLVTPSDEVAGLDLAAVDAVGRVLARARQPGRDRGLVLCSDHETMVSLVLRPRTSSGMAAVVIGRSPEGAASDLAERTWIDAASPIFPLEEALARHARRTKDLRMSAPASTVQATVPVGTPSVLSVDLGAGCSRIDLIGGAPLGPFTAEIWSSDDRRLARTRGAETATAFLCGPAQNVRLEIVGDRAGPIAMQVRRDAQPPALLLAHPSAAARLLSRLEDAAGPVDPREAEAAKPVDVQDGVRREQPVAVSADSCVDVLVALDDGPRSLELTLEPASGEPTTTRGALATGQRVCAGAAPADWTATWTVLRGQGTSLVLIHVQK